MRRRRTIIEVLCLLHLLGGSQSHGQAESPTVKPLQLLTPAQESGANVGRCLDTDGDYMVAGARECVYVYKRDAQAAWQLVQTLRSPNAPADESFGLSIALHGDHLIVGAPKSGEAGAAYVFTLTEQQWTLQSQLRGNPLTPQARFGEAVDIHKDWCIVGAPLDQAAGSQSPGAAYLFKMTDGGWHQQQVLYHPQSATFPGFGYTLALAADYCLVAGMKPGHPAKQDLVTIQTWERSNDQWRPGTALKPEDDSVVNGALAQMPIALANDRVLIGGYIRQSVPVVYVFAKTDGGWSQEIRLEPTSLNQRYFGMSLAMHGSVTAIGSPCSGLAGAAQGQIDFFSMDDTGWRRTAIGVLKDPQAEDGVATAVTLNGTTCFASAPRAKQEATMPGVIAQFALEVPSTGQKSE